MTTLRLFLAATTLVTASTACKKTSTETGSSATPAAKPVAAAAPAAAPAPAAWIGAVPPTAKPIRLKADDAESKVFEGLEIMATDELEAAKSGELAVEIENDLGARFLFIRPAKLDLKDEDRGAHNLKSTTATEQPQPDLLIVKDAQGHVNALRNIVVGGKDFNCQIDDVTVETAKIALGVCASLKK